MNIDPKNVTNGPIQNLKDYVDSGGKPEEYNAYVEKRTAELAAEAMAAAQSQAKTRVRVRVIGTGWRPGQTHYKVLAKAPHDLRLNEGDPGYERNYKHEPPLGLPIGKVSEVPVRDERHLDYLKHDPCLTIVPNDTPTWEEEQALVKQAVSEIAQRGTSGKPAGAQAAVLTANVPTATTGQAPAPAPVQAQKRGLFELSEREMRERIAQTTDFAVLSAWFVEAEERGNKLVFSEVLNRMMELHGELTDFLDKAMPPLPKAPEPPKPPAPPVDPATALAGSPQAVGQDKDKAPSVDKPVEPKAEAPKPEGGDAKPDVQGGTPAAGNAPAGQGKPEEPKAPEPPKPVRPRGGR